MYGELRFLNSDNFNFAADYLVDDIRGAHILGSRIRNILERIASQSQLTKLQQDFLHQHGHEALLQLALGSVDIEAFRVRARAEQETRTRASAALQQREAADLRLREEADLRLREATKRKNAPLFAEQERKAELRRFRNRFGQPFIEKQYYRKVMGILRSVDSGVPIGKADLLFFAGEGRDYWTPQLRQTHHKILAEQAAVGWQETKDVWQAINSCGHWRKAEFPESGLRIAKKALEHGPRPKARSALLTTGGGALRDLRRYIEAVQFGSEAHLLTPKDFRPCTLLGAVHIERGEIMTGAEWYEKAEARGAKREMIDRELETILSASPQDQRVQIKKALKGYDASRFNWL